MHISNQVHTTVGRETSSTKICYSNKQHYFCAATFVQCGPNQEAGLSGALVYQRHGHKEYICSPRRCVSVFKTGRLLFELMEIKKVNTFSKIKTFIAREHNFTQAAEYSINILFYFNITVLQNLT